MADTNLLNRICAKDEEKDGPHVSAISATPPNVNIIISGNESVEDASPPSIKDRVTKAWWENEFVFLVIVAISIARAYPPLGADYVFPDITATWVAVMLIFSKSVSFRILTHAVDLCSHSNSVCSPGWYWPQDRRVVEVVATSGVQFYRTILQFFRIEFDRVRRHSCPSGG